MKLGTPRTKVRWGVEMKGNRTHTSETGFALVRPLVRIASDPRTMRIDSAHTDGGLYGARTDR